MNLTQDDRVELTDLTAGPTDGANVRRRPITDVDGWLDGLDYDVRPALRALGELLVGVAEREGAESADRFTARCLGAADCGHLLDEERVLNPVSRLTTALVLVQWIEEHEPVCEIGPGG